jgi:S-disulfanyl-L-cysteine oxidoreductase SoxD
MSTPSAADLKSRHRKARVRSLDLLVPTFRRSPSVAAPPFRELRKFGNRPACAIALVLALGLGSSHAAEGPNLGKPINQADIAAWDISILPDGTGLPPGSGNAAEGAKIYAEKCSACHGENGKGGTNGALVGGGPLDRIEAVKTVANFWGYPTTVFDFIRRAMPWPQPRSLSNEEVYALVAYIFAQNKLIGENDAMNAQTLPKVKMPNHDGFIIRFPDHI